MPCARSMLSLFMHADATRWTQSKWKPSQQGVMGDNKIKRKEWIWVKRVHRQHRKILATKLSSLIRLNFKVARKSHYSHVHINSHELFRPSTRVVLSRVLVAFCVHMPREISFKIGNQQKALKGRLLPLNHRAVFTSRGAGGGYRKTSIMFNNYFG